MNSLKFKYSDKELSILQQFLRKEMTKKDGNAAYLGQQLFHGYKEFYLYKDTGISLDFENKEIIYFSMEDYEKINEKRSNLEKLSMVNSKINLEISKN